MRREGVEKELETRDGGGESSVCEFLESVGANDRRVPLSSPLPFLASTVLVFSSIVF